MAQIEQVIGRVNEVEALAEQGCTSEVSRVVADDGVYLLKSASEQRYREWLRIEAERLRRNEQADWIPLPRFYGFFEDGDGSHLLMSFEKGVSLTAALKEASHEEKKTLIRSFGRFLHRFHERHPAESLKRSDDWLAHQLVRAEGYLERGEADGDRALLESLIRNKPVPVPQTMIHGDCTSDNVLVWDGEVYLFIDAAGMTVGDPRYDESLAVRRFQNDPELLGAFYEEYTRHRVSEAEYRYFYDGLYAFF
ncbi:phosphotransferase family protein [Paenibacillus nanensis]|nr:phosphotransferase [Paenibacillus nanensis]